MPTVEPRDERETVSPPLHTGTVTLYLLHFDRPIADGFPCQHYLGFTNDKLAGRLLDHANGRGARLTQVARERGIGWTLVRTWPGATRSDERHLKRRKYGSRLCPLCRPSTSRGLALPSGWSRRRVYRPRTVFVVPSGVQAVEVAPEPLTAAVA